MLQQHRTDKIYPIIAITIIICPLISCIRVPNYLPATTTTTTTTAAITTTSTLLPAAPEPTTNYRISVPRPEKPSNRVPPHLQDIRTGYVDDDADDVIHIIEPPSYFQQLKRQAHRQQAYQYNQPQLTIDHVLPKKPKFPTSSSASASAVDLLTQETKNLPQNSGGGGGVKTAQQMKQQQKIATILPMHLVKFQHQQQQNAVPFELLASVRHKDRFYQRSRPVVVPPYARERLKVKQIQTVLMEQGFEEQQHDRGQQLSYGGLRVQRRATGKFAGIRNNNNGNRQRMRRSVDNLMVNDQRLLEKSEDSLPHTAFEKSNDHSQIPTTVADISSGIQVPIGYVRRKRELPRNNQRSRQIRRGRSNYIGASTTESDAKKSNNTTKNPELVRKQKLLKGHDLIDHITELLRNATQYTNDGLRLTKLPSSGNKATSTAQQLGQKFIQDTSPAELIGEIEPTLSVDIKLKEKEVEAILEQSMNTTDAIMVALLNYTKLPPEKCPDESSNSAEPNKRMQLLQLRLNCIRQQIGNETMPPLSATRLSTRLRKRIAERNSNKFSTITTTTTTTPASNVAKRQRRKQQKNNFLVNLQKQPDNNHISSNISATLLYDDVMSNIRHLLQARNLEELNEEADVNQRHDFSSNLPTRSIEDGAKISDFGEFNHLNDYLNELQKIVSDFVVSPPTEENPSTSTTELTLNTNEFNSNSIGGGTSTESTELKNWYLINDEGQIYQTNLNDELHPTVAVFHRFPDIPTSEIYLHNYTLLADKTRAYEIL